MHQQFYHMTAIRRTLGNPYHVQSQSVLLLSSMLSTLIPHLQSSVNWCYNPFGTFNKFHLGYLNITCSSAMHYDRLVHLLAYDIMFSLDHSVAYLQSVNHSWDPDLIHSHPN